MSLKPTNPKAILIVSGGLDSVTLAHVLADDGYRLHILSFNYGQRHARELHFAQECATRLGAEYDCVDLTSFAHLIGGSALTDPKISVPQGHYAQPSMAITVVPNRNAIMLTLAYGVAVAEMAVLVAAGMHTGDHYVYPDCRPNFVHSFEKMQSEAVRGFGHPDLHLHAPFINKRKSDIVRMGKRLGVPFARTWSCYEGGQSHCGQCGTCVERKEAFRLAGVTDPTYYLA